MTHRRRKRSSGILKLLVMAVLTVMIGACAAVALGKTGDSADRTEADAGTATAGQKETGSAENAETVKVAAQASEAAETTENASTVSAAEKTEAAALDPAAVREAQINTVLAGMTLEQKVGQMILVSLDGFTGVSGTEIAGDRFQQKAERFLPGGYILFQGNVKTPDQLKALTAGIREVHAAHSEIPVLIGVDEEGGRVTRLACNGSFGLNKVESMLSIGQTGSPSNAAEAGRFIGSYLSEYGINLDFAPDADVLTNSDNKVIGDRSFGTDPVLVSQMSEAYRTGLEAFGVQSCLKHFPGHGATAGDTHNGFAAVEMTLEELRSAELVPFADAIENGADCIMAAHISVPKVIGDNTPASLSKVMITDILRERMGFDGVVITDALNMGAISENYSLPDAVTRAVLAGDDMLLIIGDATGAVDAVCSSVLSGEIPEERINESVKRILRIKYKWEG